MPEAAELSNVTTESRKSRGACEFCGRMQADCLYNPVHGYWVRCEYCGAATPMCRTKDKAEKKWREKIVERAKSRGGADRK